MDGDSDYLVSCFRETRRYFTFGGDNLLILPKFRSFLSQNDNCLFAVPLPMSEGSTSLRDSLLKEEILEEVEPEEESGRPVLCILDSNEDNLYNGKTHRNRCVVSLGGISRFLVNEETDQLVVLYLNNIMSVYSILSDKQDWLYLYLLATIKVNNNNKVITTMSLKGEDICLGLMDGTVLVYTKGKFQYSFKANNLPITLLKNFKDKVFVSNREGEVYLYDLRRRTQLLNFKDHTAYVKSIHCVVTKTNEVGVITMDNDNIINIWSLNRNQSNLSLQEHQRENEEDLLVLVETERTVRPFKRIIKDENIVSMIVVTGKVNEEVDARKKGSWLLLVAEESGQLYYQDPVDELVLLKNQVMYGCGILKAAEYHKDVILTLSLKGIVVVYDQSLNILKMMLSNFNYLFQMALLSSGDNREDELENNVDEVNGEDVQVDEEMDQDEATGVEELEEEKGGRERNAKMTNYEFSKKWYERQLGKKRSKLMAVLIGDEVVRILLLNNLNEFVPLGLSNLEMTHQDVVTSMHYNAKSNLLVSGSKDKRVILWDMRSLSQLKMINTIHIVTSLLLVTNKLSLGGVVDVVCSNYNMINLYSTKLRGDGEKGYTHCERRGEEMGVKERPNKELDQSDHTSVIHKTNINYIALSHNQKYISSCSNDKVIVVHQASNLIVKGRCTGHKKSVLYVEFMKVTKTLVSSSMDQTIKIWNLSDFTNIKTFQGHTNSIMKVVLLQNDLQMLSCGLEGFVKLWNIPTSECVQTLNDHQNQQVWDIELRGNLLFSASNNLIVVSEDVTRDLKRVQALQEKEEEVVKSKINRLLLQENYGESLLLAIKINNIKMTNEIINKFANKWVFGNQQQSMMGEAGDSVFQQKGGLVLEDQPQSLLEDKGESVLSGKGEEDIFDYVMESIRRGSEEEKKVILKNLLNLVKVWITNRRNYFLANVFINKLLKEVKLEELMKVEGLLNTVEFLLFNLSSHQSRLSSLQEKSYLLDIITQHNPAGELRNTEINDVLYKKET